MSKFNRPGVRPATTSPVKSTGVRARTALGGQGWLRDEKSELFLLSVANMVGEETFHEKASVRDERYRTLIQKIAIKDFDWILKLSSWLRGEAFMRSASTLLAVHAVHVRTEAGLHEKNDELINSVLQRPDEPGEFLAAWHSLYGRALPKSVKRGLAQAIGRLYTERSTLKYDAPSKEFRFADLIEIVHPKPVGSWQADLFRYLLDERHHADGQLTESLTMLRANRDLRNQARTGPSILYNADRLAAAGMTWEDVLSLGGELRLDKARLWEAVIPSMGVMALIRNLRNFDQAGVSDAMAKEIGGKIADAEQVRRSRQFPFRFLAAYRAASSLRWSWPLEQALGHSLTNVPQLGGRTLILVDRSGSMFGRLSEKTQLNRADSAAVFGTALALRAKNADLIEFGSSSQPVQFSRGESVLKIIGRFNGMGGTNTASAVRQHYQKHDRVVIITDEQAGFSYYGDPTEQVPANVPVYTWNLAGYQVGHGQSGSRNRHTFGGLSDNAFRMIPILEAGRSGTWPWDS